MVDEAVPCIEQIDREFHAPLSGYLKKMTGNDADAGDILQETLIRVARGLPKFKQESSLKTWVFKIATNAAVDFFRRSKRAQFVEFDETADSPADFDDDEPLVVGEMNQCIRNVIDGLPPDYRAAVVLYNIEGHSITETAQICGISVPTAKIRVHRAKARLREALRRKCDFYKSPEGALRCDIKNKDQSGR